MISKKLYFMLVLNCIAIQANAPEAPIAPAAPGAPEAPTAPGLTGQNENYVISQEEINLWPQNTQIKIQNKYIDKIAVKPGQIKANTKIKLPSGKEIFAKSADYDAWKSNQYREINNKPADAQAGARGRKQDQTYGAKVGEATRAKRAAIESAELTNNFKKFDTLKNPKDRITAFEKMQESYAFFKENFSEPDFLSIVKMHNIPEAIGSLEKIAQWIAQHKAAIEIEQARLKTEQASELQKQRKQNAIKIIKETIMLPVYAIVNLKPYQIATIESGIKKLKEQLAFLNDLDFNNLSTAIKNKSDFDVWLSEQEKKVSDYKILHPNKPGKQQEKPNQTGDLASELKKRLEKESKANITTKQVQLDTLRSELNALTASV
jgi:hypothetical protein